MNKLLYIFFIFFLGSCAVIPKNENKAKNKISDYKDKIEKIAAYHNLDSVWMENKPITIKIPEVKKQIVFKDSIIEKTKIDSVILENCKDSIKVKEYIYKNILSSKPINYEDSLLVLTVLIKPDGVVVDYKLKEQKIKKEVPCEQTVINANIPWHKERPVRIAGIILLCLIVLGLTKKYL
jgi:hypothetical protein